ncbi:MAG: hypothetical protein HY513_00360 [Candidatus Aenigmarchaeota archaeon]|nr:hypothetical protein [Candidatus Aenigmarchaeota archaeon]
MTGGERKSATLLWNVLRSAGPEYDNEDRPKCTSRITGVMFPIDGKWRQALGVVTKRNDPMAVAVGARDIAYDGKFHWVPTYDGNVDYANFPDPQRVQRGETVFEFKAETPQGLADELFDMTDYKDPKYGLLRVCTIAGVRNGKGPGGWDFAVQNRHDIIAEYSKKGMPEPSGA